MPYCHGLVRTNTHLTYYDSPTGPSATKQKLCRNVCLCTYSHAYIHRMPTTAALSICLSVYIHVWKLAKWIFIKFDIGEFSKKKKKKKKKSWAISKFFWQWTILTVTLHKTYTCFCTHIHKHSYPITTQTDYWHPCSAYVQFLLYIGKVLQIWKIKQDLVSHFLGCGTEWLGIWFPTFYSLMVPLSRVIRISKHGETNIQWCGIKTQKNWQTKLDFYILKSTCQKWQAGVPDSLCFLQTLDTGIPNSTIGTTQRFQCCHHDFYGSRHTIQHLWSENMYRCST